MVKFVRVERQADPYGFLVSAEEYLQALPRFKEELPPGAREFASDPAHYDFYGSRCVKDLTLVTVHLSDDGLHLTFGPNEWKHEGGLEVSYTEVGEFDVRLRRRGTEAAALGSLMLDEILPHSLGCSHEFVFTGGSVRIVSGDLSARWMDAVAEDAASRHLLLGPAAGDQVVDHQHHEQRRQQQHE
ncbi:hypothetical protein FDA94_34875 [Herbidospora galbida]|uniref:Uncharacterized protein n=1 Tax=Herbidospora galbida TaxID=2575442 RepID=A0A4U3LZM1_9ACTN|nr:hypothetical protein [Herbidospora galbida]TKK80904.1 hypothetical protein FDA94_34875 [Herbidospora galbida]